MIVDYIEFIKNSKYIKELGMWLFEGMYYIAHLRSNNTIELR